MLKDQQEPHQQQLASFLTTNSALREENATLHTAKVAPQAGSTPIAALSPRALPSPFGLTDHPTDVLRGGSPSLSASTNEPLIRPCNRNKVAWKERNQAKGNRTPSSPKSQDPTLRALDDMSAPRSSPPSSTKMLFHTLCCSSSICMMGWRSHSTT